MRRTAFDWAGNIAAFLLVIIVNELANALPINGQTTGAVSDRFPTLFTPAGFTFAIWGVIYCALALFIIYQALPSQRDNHALARVHLLFKLNCLANIGWIFAWHYQLWSATALLMAVILVSLLLIYRRLDIEYRPPFGRQTLLVFAPFSLYLGWITVATLANISVIQAVTGTLDWGLSEYRWTLVKLALAGAIGVSVLQQRRDILFILVICWAATGIAVGQQGNPGVVGAASVLAVLGLLLAAARALLLWRR